MSILRRRFVYKSLAIFFLLEFVISIISPTISWALTAGPTAPEATSFEPVDTTDMVNINTGDLVYNLPLLDVPGPNGGFPLSLSYHSGIKPDYEASWVGLGWTLNPGSINRFVNGVPDDYNGTKSLNRLFFEGGTTTASSIGFSIGFGGFGSVTAGMTFANDTYRGRGMGNYNSFGLNINSGFVSVGISQNYNKSPYSLNGSESTVYSGSLNIPAGIGSYHLSMNSESGIQHSFNPSLGSLGISFSAKGNSVSASVGTSKGAFSMQTNNYKNKLSGNMLTNEKSSSVVIPVYYGINLHLGRSYVRYWQDETIDFENYGSAYFPDNVSSKLNSSLFDTYHVPSSLPSADTYKREKSLEGSYPDYDSYQVNAQDIGGTIRPYHYTLSLYSQKIGRDNPEVISYLIPQHSIGMHYRFENEFSNKVLQEPIDIEINKVINQQSDELSSRDKGEAYKDWLDRVKQEYPFNTTVPLFYPFGNPLTGKGAPTETIERKFPNVPGSRHIEHFTNEQIVNNFIDVKRKGFIECNAKGFVRGNYNVHSKIGGFVITNSDGMNYHFSLPVYANSEVIYQQNKDYKDKISFNLLENKGFYAYTWLLTAITGPDYVDRGPAGIPDNVINEFDWGYWVEFQYGKWTSSFRWRNPGIGLQQDYDSDFESFSRGIKEIYYLDAIKTKSHTALFIKQMRADSKSSVVTTGNLNPVMFTLDNNVAAVDQGGFDFIQSNGEFPKASLKLSKIVLLDNSKLPIQDIRNLTNNYHHSITYGGQIFPYHNGKNILDIFDFDEAKRQGLIRQADIIREIKFVHDYELTPNTINSFDEMGSNYCVSEIFYPNTTTPVCSLNYNGEKNKRGKLTLKSIEFKGKGGIQLMPSYFFQYELDNPFKGQVYFDKNSFFLENTELEKGDILKSIISSKTYYMVVTDIENNIHTIKSIENEIIPKGQMSFVVTKNPPYNNKAYDIWGNYKPDFNGANSNLNRYPSEISAKSSDVWTLRKIITPLGAEIKIDYESDTYSKTIFGSRISLPAKMEGGALIDSNVCGISGPENGYTTNYVVNLTAETTNQNINLATTFKLGDQVKFTYSSSGSSSIGVYGSGGNFSSGGSAYGTITFVSKDKIKFRTCLGKLGATTFFVNQAKVYLKNDLITKGGGVRVKSITINNNVFNNSSRTSYEYEFDGKSSGVTSYEPLGFEVDKHNSSKEYKDSQMEMNMEPQIFGRYIPAPAVFYSSVITKDSYRNKTVDFVDDYSYRKYDFIELNKSMIGFERTEPISINSVGSVNGRQFQKIVTRKVKLKNFLQRVGELKRIVTYTSDGKVLNSIQNSFLFEEQTATDFNSSSNQYQDLLQKFNHQGIIQETFNHAKWVKVSSTSQELRGLVSTYETYPLIKTETIKIDYKSGQKVEEKILEYDFYSGKPTLTYTSDGINNAFITKETPAYLYYPKLAMKSFYQKDNQSNKNMLDQHAYSVVYKVDPSNPNLKLGLVSANVQTWSNQIKAIEPGQDYSSATIQQEVWRKHANYSFVGDENDNLQTDGLMPISSLSDFNAWNLNDQIPIKWQKNGEITLYDVNSHALEAKDLNNLYATTKFSFDQSQVLTTATNSEYSELAFSSAEELPKNDLFNVPSFGGEVYFSGVRSSERAHTGSFSIKANANVAAFSYSFKPKIRTYLINYWTTNEIGTSVFYQTDGLNPSSASTKRLGSVANWHLMQAKITINQEINSLKIWCQSNTNNTFFDDFKIAPIDATVLSYVYNKFGELSHILDNNHLFTEYRYDELGRLKSTYKETLKAEYGLEGIVKVSEITYNFSKNRNNSVNLIISKSGPSGSAMPLGVVPVDLDGSKLITFKNDCPNINTLEKVLIDGKVYAYSLTPRTITLPSGTEVLIQGGSVTFKRISASHKVEGVFGPFNFTPPSVPGIVYCVTDNNGCFTGQYSYSYYDECGQAGPIQVGYSVPNDLVHLIDDSSCRNVAGSGCPEY
ncbi:MAG: hypothetical protein O9294_17725 [Cytophagales bacterium]|jgi:YD repeat-containing protein|nr:hypothetical protein [Cytophagales bacterium]